MSGAPAWRRAAVAITANTPYKVLSVLIALALWFIVRDERIETSVPMSLEVEAVGELVVGNESLPELTVGVAGTRVALDRLRRESITHVIKLKTTEPGMVVVHVKPEDLALPRGVEVVHVSPSTVNVRLESRAVRRVPVRPRIVLEGDSTWRVKKVTVTPDRVRIGGPASVVASVDQVWTEAIVVPPKSGDPVTGSYSLSLPHPQLHAEDASTVSVRVELEEVALDASHPGH
jgi:YbbR domain-containing protein